MWLKNIEVCQSCCTVHSGPSLPGQNHQNVVQSLRREVKERMSTAYLGNGFRPQQPQEDFLWRTLISRFDSFLHFGKRTETERNLHNFVELHFCNYCICYYCIETWLRGHSLAWCPSYSFLPSLNAQPMMIYRTIFQNVLVLELRHGLWHLSFASDSV